MLFGTLLGYRSILQSQSEILAKRLAIESAKLEDALHVLQLSTANLSCCCEHMRHMHCKDRDNEQIANGLA